MSSVQTLPNVFLLFCRVSDFVQILITDRAIGEIAELRARLSSCQTPRNGQSFLINDYALDGISTTGQPNWHTCDDLFIARMTHTLRARRTRWLGASLIMYNVCGIKQDPEGRTAITKDLATLAAMMTTEDERESSLTISALADLVISLPLNSQLTRGWRYPVWSRDLLRNFSGWDTEFRRLRKLGSEISRGMGNSRPVEIVGPMGLS